MKVSSVQIKLSWRPETECFHELWHEHCQHANINATIYICNTY